MWARVHKIDRIRPLPAGGAIVLIEDERGATSMGRLASLSVLIAIACVLNARRVLDTRYAGKGAVHYATGGLPPPPVLDAITRAGAHITDSAGDRIAVPAAPSGISAVVDHAFTELAHHLRTYHAAHDMAAALRMLEAARRQRPLDRDRDPAAYWTSVFELAALAGELSRPRGGRWIETTEMPVPFAVKLASGELAVPTKLAQQIVEGTVIEDSLAPQG